MKRSLKSTGKSAKRMHSSSSLITPVIPINPVPVNPLIPVISPGETPQDSIEEDGEIEINVDTTDPVELYGLALDEMNSPVSDTRDRVIVKLFECALEAFKGPSVEHAQCLIDLGVFHDTIEHVQAGLAMLQTLENNWHLLAKGAVSLLQVASKTASNPQNAILNSAGTNPLLKLIEDSISSASSSQLFKNQEELAKALDVLESLDSLYGQLAEDRPLLFATKDRVKWTSLALNISPRFATLTNQDCQEYLVKVIYRHLTQTEARPITLQQEVEQATVYLLDHAPQDNLLCHLQLLAALCLEQVCWAKDDDLADELLQNAILALEHAKELDPHDELIARQYLELTQMS